MAELSRENSKKHINYMSTVQIVLVSNAIIFGEHRKDALTNWAWSLLCSEVEDDGGPEVHLYHTIFGCQ